MLKITSFSFIKNDDDTQLCDVCNEPIYIGDLCIEFLDNPDVCGHIECLSMKFYNELKTYIDFIISSRNE